MALSYTSVSRLYSQLPALEEASSISSAQLLTFVEDAEAEVNAAISPLYTIPATGSGVPPLLRTITTDLALYNVLAKRIFTQERMRESSWPSVFKEAHQKLEDIASGKRQLVSDDGTLVAQLTTHRELWSSTKDYLPTFTELGDYDQDKDKDKTDDLEDDLDDKHAGS